MAVIEFINNKGRNSGTITHLKRLCNYSQKETKTESKYVTGLNCVPELAFEQFINTKLINNQKNGRNFIHFIQSFSQDDKVTLELAHEIACKLADRYKDDYEVIIATHKDTKKIHTHFIINSVSFSTGKKFQQSANELQNLKDCSDKLCIEYGLSVIKTKNKKRTTYKEYQARLNNTSWKQQLEQAIENCLKTSNNQTEFINNMNSLGYKVKWFNSRKYITYTTPDNIKCRDIKLADEKFTKAKLENYFCNKNIINSSTSLIDNILKVNENEMNITNNIIDLSKRAKKELYLKSKEKSYLWDKEK